MSNILNSSTLLLSLQRALLGEVHSSLRQASIEADTSLQVIHLRFEYDGAPTNAALESSSCVAAEVIADFPSPWKIDEQHISAPAPNPLLPLAHVAFRRLESQHAV